MRILIAGGGIGGLALAAFLKKSKHQILLIEKAHHWRNIGYAVILWPNGGRILKELDIYEKARQKSAIISRVLVTDEKNKVIKKVDATYIKNKYGPLLGIERSTIHHLLREQIKDIPKKLNTTIEKVDQNRDVVRVEFSDRKVDFFDMVIGADGIHSKLRAEQSYLIEK